MTNRRTMNPSQSKKLQIEIDAELRDLLPTPTPQELEELERSILREGCREPLVCWRHGGKLTLLDGHSRKIICGIHAIKYKVLVKTTAEIPDRDAAMEWILRNQLARRNLTPEQFSLYLGKLYNAQKGKQGGTGANQHTAQSGHRVHSAQRLADEHGVNERTVRRAGEFAEAVEKAKERDPDIEKKVVRGEVTRKQIVDQGKIAATGQGPFVDEDGVEIPEDLLAVFAEAENFETIKRDLFALRTRVEAIMEANPQAYSHVETQEFHAMIARWAQYFNEAKPILICSNCGSIDPARCRSCGGLRWLPLRSTRTEPIDTRNINRAKSGLPPLEKSSQKATRSAEPCKE